VAKCGHGGTVGKCDLCRQETIMGHSTKKEPPQHHSQRMSGNNGHTVNRKKGKK
jgi:hypothetical protein